MKHLRTIVLSGVLAIAFTACGGGGGSSSGGETDDTIIHNGVEYKTVVSPYTGRVWLDRNLGAAEVCETFDDVACYGDYYQWGRDADGHEDGTSATTATLASSITPGHDRFIKTNGGDWVANGVDDSGVLRAAEWSKTDGSSVCPAGFRVATFDELKAELFDSGSAEIDKDSSQKSGNSDDRRVNAFNTFLKLPISGDRKQDGAMENEDSIGALWSVTEDTHHKSGFVGWEQTGATYWGADRAYGLNVRCIKE
jgi:uncharacterized protein (TIGR02145 family)